MILSKSKIKFLSSLKLKKFREEYGQFIAEGDKLVRDSLQNGKIEINLLAATPEWLNANKELVTGVKEIYEADARDLARISGFETPPPVIVLAGIPNYSPDPGELMNSLSIALDSIQDPGNLGTIIRTADWFNIRNIFCNRDCADIYNPKVIQASMGAMFNVKVHYNEFEPLFRQVSEYKNYTIAGTFLAGEPVTALRGIKTGMLIFGNESRGISESYVEFITKKVTIPVTSPQRIHVESLNVASSVAVTLALLTEITH